MAEHCAKIRAWSASDHVGLMSYLRSIWAYVAWGWTETQDVDVYSKCAYNVYDISTAGWSDNEALIEALEDNSCFWAMCWEQSRRGGYYIFRVRV